MFFSIPLSHSSDYYCDKIDQHIKEDFETKIPDYGAEAFNPIGFHFERKENKIKGIYRSKYAKNGGNAFLPQSTHMHFRASIAPDKNGELKLKVFMFPQFSQIFFLIVSLAFALLLVKNFVNTYIYVTLFAVMILFSLSETVKLTVLVNKEFKKFFD